MKRQKSPCNKIEYNFVPSIFFDLNLLKILNAITLIDIHIYFGKFVLTLFNIL